MTEENAKQTIAEIAQRTIIGRGMDAYLSYHEWQALLTVTGDKDLADFEEKYAGYEVRQIADGTAIPEANLKHLHKKIADLRTRFNQELDEILEGVKL